MNYSLIIPTDRVQYFKEVGLQLATKRNLSDGWTQIEVLIRDAVDMQYFFQAGVNCGIDAAFETIKN